MILRALEFAGQKGNRPRLRFALLPLEKNGTDSLRRGVDVDGGTEGRVKMAQLFQQVGVFSRDKQRDKVYARGDILTR